MVRNLTVKEKIELGNTYLNFAYFFSRRFAITRDTDKRRYKISIFEGFNSFTSIEKQHFTTLKKLQQGLEDLLKKHDPSSYED